MRISQLPGTLKQYAAKIESVSDERGSDNGYWVNLNNGWKDGSDPLGAGHTIHEDTQSDCSRAMASVMLCDCEDCKNP
jgi:hypothetical protein